MPGTVDNLTSWPRAAIAGIGLPLWIVAYFAGSAWWFLSSAFQAGYNAEETAKEWLNDGGSSTE